MTKQLCVRTYEDYSTCETLNSYLDDGWKVVMVTPKPKYNEYIIEKEEKDD